MDPGQQVKAESNTLTEPSADAEAKAALLEEWRQKVTSSVSPGGINEGQC